MHVSEGQPDAEAGAKYIIAQAALLQSRNMTKREGASEMQCAIERRARCHTRSIREAKLPTHVRRGSSAAPSPR